MPFDRVAILGTGLIGASVGLALRAARPNVRVVGYDPSAASALGAERRGAVHQALPLVEAVAEAELVIVATPVGAMELLFEELGRHLSPGAVVTDTGGSKEQVLAWAKRWLPSGVDFVGGHPMAGKTESGPTAADPNLFQGAVWCLTPTPEAARAAIDGVADLVRTLGADPYFIDAAEHDAIVASVSHLPYLMAVALVSHLGGEPGWREASRLAAGGFASASRLADSDPRMFADIARTNRERLVERLDRYLAELQSFRDAIDSNDPSVKQRFERAQQIYRKWRATTPSPKP